jgi:hypothetical protein
MSDAAGRRVWAALELLDRQLVDRAGYLAGKVDDLEFALPDNEDEFPILIAVLSGLGSLASHIGGNTGRWLAAVEKRLANEPAPSRIPYELVTDIGASVRLSADRDDLDSNRAERWTRDVIITNIPGAGHETE